jgi:DTW domain-containing protein YfiP
MQTAIHILRYGTCQCLTTPWLARGTPCFKCTTCYVPYYQCIHQISLGMWLSSVQRDTTTLCLSICCEAHCAVTL